MSLQLHQLHKRYPDGIHAVRGVDLDCGDGQLVVLLGPSGCGKTTTLRMIAGLEDPTSGTIILDGSEVTALPPQQRDVGFVFQFYALYPHMTVAENIGFPLESTACTTAERRRRVGDVMERLGLSALASRRPPGLSGGDQQRVALARAMVRRPALYLMDEPLGTLDAALRRDMRELIRAQQLELGVTTVYVTHDQEEAMNLADLVVVMREGVVRQTGSPEVVYDAPVDLFVAHFMGSPGMNFLEGEIGGAEDGVFCAGDCRVPVGTAWKGNATLGIRPEFVTPADDGVLRGRVVMDEYLGDCRNVHVDTPCGRLVMRDAVEGSYRPGESIGLRFDAEHVRLFDSASGEGLP